MRHHFERVVAYDLLQKLPVRHCHEIPELHAITLNISRSRAMNDPKLLMMGRAALTLLTGRRTEMKFTRKFRAGKTFRIFKGMPVGASVTLDRKMDGYRFLQLWRQEILPDMPREYLGAGTSRSGGIGSGVHGTLRVLQEISESFDRFSGFAWNGSVDCPHRLRHHREDVTALVFTGLGIPVRGKMTREVEKRFEEAAQGEGAGDQP